ncbi:hypothetical protein NHQ30_003407 [Ciborinia camelliae]|nr:hypothetical protein NHQ30_003407 [Ciborinia camelliae]
MVGTRTRAQGASPGGFKQLEDIPKPARGKGKGRGKKIKTEPVEEPVGTESADPFITTAPQDNNNTESQKAHSPTTNDSRTNSPESHSPSPTPVDSRLDSRSTSPPPKNNITSNDASSDNDITHQEQDAEPIAPLGSNRKRSRVEEPSTHQSVGITDRDAEEVLDLDERSSKRTRIEENDGVEDLEVVVEADVEAEESTEPEPEPEKKSRGRARNRTKRSPKKSATKARGRKQDPVVFDSSSSDEAFETMVSPLQSRSKSASKQTVISSPRTPRTPQNKPGNSSAEEDEPQAGPSTISHPSFKLALPPPDVRPVPQTEIKKPAPSLAEIGPDPEQRMKAAAKHYGFPPIARAVSSSTIKLTPGMGKTERIREMHMRKYFPDRIISPSKGKEVAKEVTKEATQDTNDVCSISPITNLCHDADMIQVAQTERKKMTAVVSSSENLSKSDVPSSTRQSPQDGLTLTDPYLVAVAKAFTNHKDKSKVMPTVEQITAFLDNFDSQKASYNVSAQMVTEQPTLPPQPKTPKTAGFVVPGYGSDEDTVMSDENDDEDAAEVAEEPKTPEAQIAPEPEATPQSSWWNPISTVATMLTSPFRKQPVPAPAPRPIKKLVPPPFIFNQPAPAPAAIPLKRMSKSDRNRNTRNNVQGRLGAGFQSERRLRHKDIERTPAHKSGLLTPAEVKEIHRAQDEYAAKHQNRGPLIVANRDIHKASRASQRSTVTDPVEEETQEPTFVHTPAKVGDKRDADGAPRSPSTPQPWNEFLSTGDFEEEDFGPRWVRCPNGLYMRANATLRQLEFGEVIDPNDPRFEDYYRDIDAFPKQDIYKPAGVQNPLNSAQLLEQANLRAQGVADIPAETENDYTYVTDERQKRLIFYPRSPYNMFDVPGRKLTANHMANIKQGLPLLNPRDEFGIAIKVPAYDSTRLPRDQNKPNVFEQLHDWDKKHYYKDAVEMKAGRILEPKQWTQTPPPKPKPGNAKLPGTLDKAPMSEAVQQAMNKANKYLPAKSSGLRNVSTMSPLQVEQDKGKGVAREPVHPLKMFDFSDEALGWKCDPLVKERVLERLGEGYIPITPMPDHIYYEHDDLEQGEVEQAVARVFAGLDARMLGSAHHGIIPENDDGVTY